MTQLHGRKDEALLPGGGLGTFLRSSCSSRGNDSDCAPCPTGTFRAQPNTFRECQACYECDRHGELVLCHMVLRCAMQRLCCAAHHLSPAAFQSVLSNCSATSNIACGCEPGRFRDCLDEHCSTQLQDTLCGTCKPDFYAEGGECRPCHTQLYAVIDAVPVRRWKEFMRVLELREAEIELVELEVAHIRDQQYEMLKRWCQQTSATLDRIFAALEHMDLGGCAEALRRSLPAGP
ncbi:Tnfrsf25 [Columba livia]|nr:Tnfrsf25 [Columba livia]